jgi:hypothetical protein
LDRHDNESGDTLVEVLIAIVIISLTVVALMGTLTTSITSSAEYRSLATVDTVLKNFAEAIKNEVQLGPTPLYSPCATSYQVANEYPTSAVIGAGVTVFATGLPSGDDGQPVSVTVGSAPITNFDPPTPAYSVAPDGTVSVSATFTLLSVPVGQNDVVDVSVGSTMVQTATPLTVAPAAAVAPPVSAAAGYTVVITSVGWWNDASSPTTGNFDSLSTGETKAQCLVNANDEYSGIQMVTLQATAPNHVQDSLSEVVTNPAYSAPPGPSITVSASAPSNPPVPDQRVTFTASVTGSNGVAPTGTLAWSVGGGPTPVSCTNANPGTSTGSSGNTSTWACILSAAEVNAGTYDASVSYSGDTTYGPATGSGSVTISPFTISNIQFLGTPGLIAQGDSIVITFNAPINVSAFCSSWSGSGNQTISSSFLVATITDGTSPTDDTLSLSRTGAPSGCPNINFGSLDLGSSGYVSGGNVTFCGSASNETKVTWTASSDTLTITLGSQNTCPNSLGTTASSTSGNLTFTSPITDQLGDPISPSPYPIPFSGPLF